MNRGSILLAAALMLLPARAYAGKGEINLCVCGEEKTERGVYYSCCGVGFEKATIPECSAKVTQDCIPEGPNTPLPSANDNYRRWKAIPQAEELNTIEPAGGNAQ